MKVLCKKFSLRKRFDCVIVSADVGHEKDHPEIFTVALKSVDVSASESIFIDNSDRNLMIPRRMGMKTILFDDEKNDVGFLNRQLQKLGLKI